MITDGAAKDYSTAVKLTPAVLKAQDGHLPHLARPITLIVNIERELTHDK